MTILDIETLNKPVLRQKARPVTVFDDDLQQLIDDMIETMREANGEDWPVPRLTNDCA